MNADGSGAARLEVSVPDGGFGVDDEEHQLRGQGMISGYREH